MSALLVATGVHTIPGSGRETGAYAAEVAESWLELTAAGHRVDIVCVGGGAVPLEARDPRDPAQRALFADPRMSALLADAPPIAAALGVDHDVVLVVGGHGAAFDLPTDVDLASVLVDTYERGRVVASVCHGAAGLLGAVLGDGTPLVAGRRVAAFSDDEERAVGMLGSMPYLLSSALTRLGAMHDAGLAFMPHVVVDGRIVTGQNPASTRGVARTAAQLVAARPAAGAARGVT